MVEKIKSYRELIVWQKSLNFAKDTIELAENNSSGRKLFRLMEQIQSSSASVPMNIAEGWSRKGNKEFIQYLYIARGSLNETLTLLELFLKLNWISIENSQQLFESGNEISKMIFGLIKSLRKSS